MVHWDTNSLNGTLSGARALERERATKRTHVTGERCADVAPGRTAETPKAKSMPVAVQNAPQPNVARTSVRTERVGTNGERIVEVVIPIQPMGAPRMSSSDRWRNPRRPVVQRYFDMRAVMKSAVGDIGLVVPDELNVRAFVAMPESWSKKSKNAMDGKPHKQKSDADNICKFAMDSLFDQDCEIWKLSVEKRWCQSGQERLELTMTWLT